MALSGFMGGASAFDVLLVFASGWALGYSVVGGLTPEATLPLQTPRFISQDWHFYCSTWIGGVHGNVVGVRPVPLLTLKRYAVIILEVAMARLLLLDINQLICMLPHHSHYHHQFTISQPFSTLIIIPQPPKQQATNHLPFHQAKYYSQSPRHRVKYEYCHHSTITQPSPLPRKTP